MNNYRKINLPNFDSALINTIYEELLKSKYNFTIININKKNYVLTKEKSLFEINETEFINAYKQDIYYKSFLQRTVEKNSGKCYISRCYMRGWWNWQTRKT